MSDWMRRWTGLPALTSTLEPEGCTSLSLIVMSMVTASLLSSLPLVVALSAVPQPATTTSRTAARSRSVD